MPVPWWNLVRRSLLTVLVLVIFDVPFVVLGSLYLHGIWFFSGKPWTRTLVDVLFLEGAIIFAVGAFLATNIVFWDRFLLRETQTENAGDLRGDNKRLHSGIIMMLTAGFLIGVSLVIGLLLL